jgi:hypothetical protein
VILKHINENQPGVETVKKSDTKRDVQNYVRLFKSYKTLVDDTANQAPSFLRVHKEKHELDLQNKRKAKVIPIQV